MPAPVLENRTFLSYRKSVERDRLLRRLRRLARKTGVTVTVDTSHGKGSHVMVTVAGRRATVPKRLPVGTLRAICRQLGVDPEDL